MFPPAIQERDKKSLTLAACLLCLETFLPGTLSQGIRRPSAGTPSGEGPPPRHRGNSEARGPTSRQMFQYLICPPLKPRWASSVTLSSEVPLRQQSESESFQLRRFANGLSVPTVEALLLTREFCQPGGPMPQPPAVSVLHCPSCLSTLTIHPDRPS